MAKSAIDSMADYMADPMETAKEGQDQIMKGLESNNFTAKGAAFGSMLGRALNGGMDPATQKAAAEQTAVKETLSTLAPKSDTESDLDYQIRQSWAIHNTIAPHDPQQAMRIQDHIATLSEARSQQRSLDARTAEAEQETAVKSVTQGTLVFADKSGNNVGEVNRFIPGTSKPNPDFQDQFNKMRAENPDAFPVTAEKFENDRRALEVQKADAAQQLALVKAQAKADAGNVSDDVMKSYIESYAVHGPSAWNRLPPEQRNAMRAYIATSGLHESDLAMANVQLTGLKRAAGAIGAREGNIAILTTSLNGLVDKVNIAAQGVHRGDLRALNSAIIAGKTAFSDPGEQAYAVAVQGLITDYARIMSNGVGQTSDTSRDHAAMLLPLNSSPEAQKAAGEQMKKEVEVVKGAADEAMEAAAKPGRYTALLRVQKALWGDQKGGGMIDYDTKSASAAASPAARPGQTSSYKSLDEAIAAGHKAGDTVTIGGVPGKLK